MSDKPRLSRYLHKTAADALWAQHGAPAHFDPDLYAEFLRHLADAESTWLRMLRLSLPETAKTVSPTKKEERPCPTPTANNT